ncbi:hypothetical protein OGAPHI_003397 [Ogataea philodendri]|uniref:Uncharacterized protein n=1 Tax=Ogataea philodendri TaxID=1378263 RepID=A0A9P8P7U6_9ASCO|nr:uncharacterized protein OGAPHI_003397 [Ogataea philodendri]KAH3666947.1 hypothetical protein OGAPHI_003397 [Ogataea philodendri]
MEVTVALSNPRRSSKRSEHLAVSWTLMIVPVCEAEAIKAPELEMARHWILLLWALMIEIRLRSLFAGETSTSWIWPIARPGNARKLVCSFTLSSATPDSLSKVSCWASNFGLDSNAWISTVFLSTTTINIRDRSTFKIGLMNSNKIDGFFFKSSQMHNLLTGNRGCLPPPTNAT